MLTLAKTGESGLTLDLHLALVQGSPLPDQVGRYLKDSFRRDILIPAFEELNQEIEAFTAEIERLELLVGVLQGLNATMIFLMILLIWTLRNGSLKTTINLEKLKERGDSITQV